MKLLSIVVLISFTLNSFSQTKNNCEANLLYKQEKFYKNHPELLPTNSYNLKDEIEKIKQTAVQQNSLMTYDSVSEKNLNEFLEQLSLVDTNRVKKYEDPYILWYFSYLQKYLESTLNKIPSYKTKSICFGSLPSTEPNAYTESVDNNSYIIIFNRYLFLYINELLKLGLSGIEKRKEGNGISFKIDSFDVAKKRIGKDTFLFSRMSELINAFVNFNPLPEQNFLIAKEYEIFQYALLIGTERFIMSHELAHVLLNHQESETVMDLWSRELTADVVGYKIYSDATLNSKDTIDIAFRDILLSVPIFYFQITDILTEANSLEKKSAESLTSNETKLLLKYMHIDKNGIVSINAPPRTFDEPKNKLKYPDGITRSALLIAIFPDYMSEPDISVITARNIRIIWDNIKQNFVSH